jgi:predicted AlkP superfamily phosphohydrolase/phosphomutase
MQMCNGTNRVMRTRADHLRRLPFWAQLEGSTETAVVVDVPKMAPFIRINGVQVVEWGTGDHYWSYATAPGGLAAPLLREFGQHTLLKERRPPTSVAACLQLKNDLVRGVTMKHRLHTSFLERYQPRIFISVFGEPHIAGHYFWRFMDEKYPDYYEHPEASRALLQVYAAVDRAVGEIFEKYSHRANCFVFAGHGMTGDYEPSTILDDLLSRMGLTVRANLSSPSQSVAPRRSRARFVKIISDALPLSVKRVVNRYMLPARAREYFMLAKALSDIDFSRTQAFALPTDQHGFIRLNLQGREPAGIVGCRQYDALCDRIEQALHGLHDAASGEKVVETVWRPRIIYPGADNLDDLPDICVMWKNTHAVSEVYSPQYGTFAVHKKHPERSGNHRLEGFYFAAGPDIATSVKHRRGRIHDIPATAFQLMNKRIPADWDGTPLPIIG